MNPARSHSLGVANLLPSSPSTTTTSCPFYIPCSFIKLYSLQKKAKMLAVRGHTAFTARMCSSKAGRRASARCTASKPDTPQTSPQVSRRLLVGSGLLATGASAAGAKAEQDERKGDRVVHTDEEWRQLLTPGQYNILRQSGTELPQTSPLNNEKRRGMFVCAGCNAPLFTSESKYNSGTGWPSFYDAVDGAVGTTMDYSIIFSPRTEIRCTSCGGHLGHLFEDGPAPTGLRYCTNGLALKFMPADAAADI